MKRLLLLATLSLPGIAMAQGAPPAQEPPALPAPTADDRIQAISAQLGQAQQEGMSYLTQILADKREIATLRAAVDAAKKAAAVSESAGNKPAPAAPSK